ncbi:MAG: hypothetical protein EOO40_01395 [Deltaproteobacteria bacterium]|nr:MAG: hypothetical protein EOO40_01395 [Deltaproteobacteria bacterium]
MEPSQDHLSKLWQESSQELAVAFLRRAIRPESTLVELLATLEFPNLNADLQSIRLRDVLTASAPALAPVAVVAPTPPPRSLAKLQGKRRRPQQTAQLQKLLLTHIRAQNSGIRTPELSSLLRAKGFDVDTATANLILKGMEDAGQVVGDEGRPRLWRAKAVGRTVPEPVVIRKAPPVVAAVSAPKPAVEAVQPAPKVAEQAALLSQSEVQAAAAALRERFFATK